jgi:hypothetical protein
LPEIQGTQFGEPRLETGNRKMGNNSGDKAEEEEDGWDDGLAEGHCRKFKELSSESLGLKQEIGNLDARILFPVSCSA